MTQMPLWEAVQRHLAAGYRPWHVPAHKQGKAVWPPFKEAVGEEIFKYDLTELPGLGDLHTSRGPVAASQELTARALAAGEAFFLVNGASVGLQAAMLAYTRPGDTVLLPRNMHISAVAAMILTGVRPVYLPVEDHRSLGLPLGPEPAAVIRALDDHPAPRMLLLLHPTYEGVVGRTAELAAVAREHGVIVLADAAHGGHFPFHPGLPVDALAAGADIAVYGWHKTLGSLTQTAVVGVRHGFSGERLRQALDYLQTTSPSFMLLLSLEAARQQITGSGKEMLGRAVAAAAFLKEELRRAGWELLDDQLAGYRSVAALDPLKVVVAAAEGLTGYQLAEKLRREQGVQVEAAGPAHVLLYFSLADGPAEARELCRALQAVGRTGAGAGGRKPAWSPPPWPEVVMTPREAFLAPAVRVSRGQAGGRIAAETVASYPPGIPALVPGERITPAVQEYLEMVTRAGVAVHGAGDPGLDTLAVVGEV